MKYFFNAFFCLLLISNQLQAQQSGLDLLGLAKHDVEMVSQELGQNTSIGFLDGTFGDPYEKLKVLLDSGKVTSVRIHLWDHTCYRNKVCVKGVPSVTDIRRVTNRTIRFVRFMEAYPNVKQYISPALEHDVKVKSVVNEWFKEIAKEAPSATLVCSAFTGYCPKIIGGKKVLSEKHGCKARGDIISPDGASHFDCNNFKYPFQAKVIQYSWINQNNGRVTGEKTFTTPKKRVNWPTRDDIKQQVELLKFAPKRFLVRGCEELKRPNLFKTNSEFFGAARNDPRGNKAMVIHTDKVSKFEIFSTIALDLPVDEAEEGVREIHEKVGEMRYYGSYQGGGHRYYIGGMFGSNQNPVQLKEALGSEEGVIIGAGKCYYINAIRRLGYYR